ncbi:Receptor-interacting serine/threonine-protein kinase 1 [Porites harrisoni]
MPQEEVAVHPNSKRHATCSDSQLPKRMKLTVKKGTPSDEDLEKLSQQIGKSWKPLGRRLKFKEADLTAFHKENPDEYTEKAYQMLLRWKSRDGKEATYLVLYEALDHELVQQKLLAENICCD